MQESSNTARKDPKIFHRSFQYKTFRTTSPSHGGKLKILKLAPKMSFLALFRRKKSSKWYNKKMSFLPKNLSNDKQQYLKNLGILIFGKN